jgi:hypothetical protein
MGITVKITPFDVQHQVPEQFPGSSTINCNPRITISPSEETRHLGTSPAHDRRQQISVEFGSSSPSEILVREFEGPHNATGLDAMWRSTEIRVCLPRMTKVRGGITILPLLKGEVNPLSNMPDSALAVWKYTTFG